MKPKILLVNPPIFDFIAYDFWMRPYGLLRVAGYLRNKAGFDLFDYMDRSHSYYSFQTGNGQLGTGNHETWGRGDFYSEIIPKPLPLSNIPRYYRRLGLPRKIFQNYLEENGHFEYVLIQTIMTYWYLGIKEVIEDIRQFMPKTKIILGGVYATLCPDHARSLGADLVVEGLDLNPLWHFLNLSPDLNELPLWDLYKNINVGVLKLADGCPFKCTYCSVPQVYPKFIARPIKRCFRELEFLCELGVKNIAFYDDALLYQPQKILIPFLEEILKRNIKINFHTPNALNARFITKEIADLMIQAGFKSFYLGFESSAYEWQKKTGGKVYSGELDRAIEYLDQAGSDLNHVTAYLIIGHPHGDQQNVEASMRFAHSLGIRLMLSEFSPIPGTPDGEACRKWVDLDEPLMHNKTAFPMIFLGEREVNRLKSLCKELNHKLCSAVDLASDSRIPFSINSQ